MAGFLAYVRAHFRSAPRMPVGCTRIEFCTRTAGSLVTTVEMLPPFETRFLREAAAIRARDHLEAIGKA